VSALPLPAPTADAAARALAVPTRAAIYRHLREVGRPRSAREVGDRVGVHANVARTHLDVLVDAGLALASWRHNPRGGRPAKVYVAREQLHAVAAADAADAVATGGPGVPAGALLGLRVVLELVAGLHEHAARSELLAEERGRRLVRAAGGRAASRPLDAARHVVVDALRPAFPAVRLRGGDLDGVRGDLAAVADVDPALADALAVGLVRGALDAAGAGADVEVDGELVRVAPRVGDGALPAPAARLDARGLGFERGVARAIRALGRVRPGAHLEVLTDEVGAPAAYARWADRAGHAIVAVDRVRDPDGRRAVRILVRRAAGR
jgi:DNA-binding transcriptional ArsR family regulator/TusA-related sulfurtransferase